MPTTIPDPNYINGKLRGQARIIRVALCDGNCITCGEKKKIPHWAIRGEAKTQFHDGGMTYAYFGPLCDDCVTGLHLETDPSEAPE